MAQQSAQDRTQPVLHATQRLYQLERTLQETSTAEQYTRRQRKNRVCAGSIERMVGEISGASTESVRERVRYTLARWDKLMRYTEDCHLGSTITRWKTPFVP